jgi:putative oligomerization/nucleic acid binding protein
MRAAAVGGTAYAVGKHVQAGKEQDADQEAPPEPTEDQPAAGAPASAPPGAIGDAAIVELQKLAELKKTGVLTQDEFDDQKRKILHDA